MLKLKKLLVPDKVIRQALIYVIFCTGLLIIVTQFVDLPFLFPRWDEKANSILSFNLKDNYYPPGAALALIPFLWAGSASPIAVYFYYALSALVYFYICQKIGKNKFKLIALIALPANAYLTWLCITSADQVIELLFLLLFAFYGLSNKFLPCLLFGWLLCLTRPAYWAAFIIIILLYKIDRKKVIRFLLTKSAALLLLIITLLGNNFLFNSPSLATSGSQTFLYSHNKYLYLSLPLFDIDVFLKNHMQPSEFIVNNEFSGIADPRIKAGLISIKENPKNFILAEIQKVNAYFFSVQKVPNLPGEYYLSNDAKSIIIGNERLSWVIVLGNAAYFIYKVIWMIFFALALSYLFFFWRIGKKFEDSEIYLLVPFFSGILPGLIFYVESRFKTCTELLIMPFLMLTLRNLFEFIDEHKNNNSINNIFSNNNIS